MYSKNIFYGLFLIIFFTFLQRNEDGSFDPIELMNKLKYKKISIDDLLYADIMGHNFDINKN